MHTDLVQGIAIFHSLKLSPANREQVTNVVQISHVTMLFEFHSCELSHVGPGGGVRYVVGTANNVPPQSHYLLPLYEMVEPQNILPSRLQPGRRLYGYRCIPAQHPLVDVNLEQDSGCTISST